MNASINVISVSIDSQLLLLRVSQKRVPTIRDSSLAFAWITYFSSVPWPTKINVGDFHVILSRAQRLLRPLSLTFANSSSGSTGSSSCYRGCPEPDEKALGATIDCLVRNAKRSENRVEVDVYVNYGYPFF